MTAPTCVCGANAYRSLRQGTHRRLGKIIDFRVVQCMRCGLARTLPVPDTTQYETGYEASTVAGEFAPRDDVWSAPRAQWIRDRAPEANTLLDVGCNDGQLGVEAERLGFAAEGIDIDPIATQWARDHGRSVFTGHVSELTRTYDVVTAVHTIEHVADPLSFLASCRERLVPGGLLFVFTPNRRSLLPLLMGESWMLWAPEGHVWHYTPRTLTNLAASVGLTPVSVTAKTVLEPPSKGAKGAAKQLVRAVAPILGLADQIEGIYRRPSVARSPS